MKREGIAKFEKVSYEQFKKDCMEHDIFIEEDGEDKLREIYDSIKLPRRSTSGSAGYDFFCPFNLSVYSGATCWIPTGIRCRIDEGWALSIVPKSGLGTKYKFRLNNTIGLIDSDYYNALNEGHIILSIMNGMRFDYDALKINKGDKFVQGIFHIYGITEDDDPVNKKRVGGFGSTGTAN